jgi:putative AbiEii toxin of type IV toxin-antitoxin system
VQGAANKYLTSVKQLFEGDANWGVIKAELSAAETQFLKACEEKGVKPEDVTRLKEIDRLRTAKQGEVDAKARQLQAVQARIEMLPRTLTNLHGVWQLQYEARRTACALIQGKNKTCIVTAGYMRDANSFKTAWERLAPRDNRTRLGKAWDDIGTSLFGAFAQAPDGTPSPWELLQQWLISPDLIPATSLAATLVSELQRHLQQPDVRPVWEKVRLTRVDDLIDVELKRSDGSSAGWMSGQGGKVLSEGQRNTALLSLILAEGDGPIVIDQPEDELDSNYIYSDLVPLLRFAKEKRQLILATHNANLPVNGDAELIYAFDAREGRGRKRTEGALDRPAVTQAVLDIMEGSEKAFKQRSEKYHF